MNNFDNGYPDGELPPLGKMTTEKDEFYKLLDDSALPQEMLQEVKSQLDDIDKDESNIVFIFTEGEYVVTGIHVPASSIDNKSGPVLMRGANDNSIIAAFSRRYLSEVLDSMEIESSLANDAGLQNHRESAWIGQLEAMAEMVRVEMTSNPPEKWDDFFMGGSR